ncbi:MAG: hypothetical protein NC432_05050 [Roseburia sp.]|nr:hypothetical protein [Roseburia sp.]MCM1098531.1 hypothetical protein [Ruminococcus flavefaciens]
MGVQNTKNAKEEKEMITAAEIDIATFNQFLQQNKEKINAITPKNPPITKDDEWRHEQVWDDDMEGDDI